MTAEHDLKKTPLYDLHVELGAKMVPFAGHLMPLQYPTGILAEHQHTRTQAGLFDVSHMGQAWINGTEVAASLEALVPSDLRSLERGQTRYTVLLNDDGGILDDMMVTRPIYQTEGSRMFVVLNASRTLADLAYIGQRLSGRAVLVDLDERSLLALQGPKAAAVLSRFAPEAATMRYMFARPMEVAEIPCRVSRTGYTGEDGFELSVPADQVEELARRLLQEPEVAPVGLGARDSLRLEAGHCLYGHDIDDTTDPIEASLAVLVGKRRREAADFPGAARILKALAEGPARRRVGFKPAGRQPARDGAVVLAPDGTEIGVVTSGGFGPTVGGPIAMGYVQSAFAGPGTAVQLVVRGTPQPAVVVKLPFVPRGHVQP